MDIDDLLNFSCQDNEAEGDGVEGQSLEDICKGKQFLSDEDVADLEWLSTSVEDSFSKGSIALDVERSQVNSLQNKQNKGSHHPQTPNPGIVVNKECHHPQTPNPGIDHPQTSNPGIVANKESHHPQTPNPGIIVPGRAHTKPSCRPVRKCLHCEMIKTQRLHSKSQSAIPLMPATISTLKPSLSLPSSELSSKLEYLANSRTTLEVLGLVVASPKKKVKLSPLPGSTEECASHGTRSVRKCSHCAMSKTPMWRNGPLGPGTLCNACGVRYRSGRLFPEYRRPTFVASMHSNKDRKVLELRSKSDQHKSGRVFTDYLFAASPTVPKPPGSHSQPMTPLMPPPPPRPHQVTQSLQPLLQNFPPNRKICQNPI